MARRNARGPSPSVDLARRINFSFVLHESATSVTVVQHAERAALHAGRLASHSWRNWNHDQLIGVQELEAMAPELILSATIGLPGVLGRIAASIRTQPGIMLADTTTGGRQQTTFFRAPAQLRLPAFAVDRLVVAAAILRPGGKSVDIACRGPFQWPVDRDAALIALEDLIRAHVAQWMPGVALWSAPADVLLPAGEIDDGGAT